MPKVGLMDHQLDGHDVGPTGMGSAWSPISVSVCMGCLDEVEVGTVGTEASRSGAHQVGPAHIEAQQGAIDKGLLPRASTREGESVEHLALVEGQRQEKLCCGERSNLGRTVGRSTSRITKDRVAQERKRVNWIREIAMGLLYGNR